MREFIEELKQNKKINIEKGLENRVDIDYIIERLEDNENLTKTQYDNLEITDTYVKGTIKDLMGYFRYEIAHQSMSDIDYENYIYNVKNTIEVIENLQEDLDNEIFTENDIMKVSEHAMGGFVIEREED
jgi:hypothetical protein